MRNSEDLQTFEKIIGEKNLVVPDFQRGYAWEEAQLNDFWDDLCALKDGKNHYTGMIAWCKNEKNEYEIVDGQWCKNEKNEYEIVDGQQRITTIFLLLIAMYQNGFKSDDKIYQRHEHWQSTLGQVNYIFSYADEKSNKYLLQEILGRKTGATVKENLYTNNLKFAYDFFCKKLKNCNADEIYKKIMENLVFNIYEVSDKYDINIVFETMNYRGKKLSNLEILKNRLIFLATRENGKNSNGIRKTINNAWRQIYQEFGRYVQEKDEKKNKRKNQNKNEQKIIDDNFLFDHWVAYFGRYNRNVAQPHVDFLLNKKFSSKNANLNIEEINNYAANIGNLAVHWVNVVMPKSAQILSREERIMLEKINHLGIFKFRPMIMVMLKLKSENHELNLVPLLKAIERFNFIYFRIGQKAINAEIETIYKMTYELNLGEISMKEIAEWIETKISENLGNFKDNFLSKIKDLFNTKNGCGYFDWGNRKALNYFLNEYEHSITPKNRINDYTWDIKTIEHILPQNGEKIDYWAQRFPQIDGKIDKKYIYALGNHLLLNQPLNSELQNAPYDKKCETYKEGSHAEIEVARDYAEWTPAAIYDRSEKLLEFLSEHWRLEFSPEQLKNLIGFELNSEI